MALTIDERARFVSVAPVIACVTLGCADNPPITTLWPSPAAAPPPFEAVDAGSRASVRDGEIVVELPGPGGRVLFRAPPSGAPRVLRLRARLHVAAPPTFELRPFPEGQGGVS